MNTKLREILGDAVYAVGNQTLEEVVAGLLGNAKKTIAIAETNTGGAVVQRLTAWPERENFLLRGVVAMSPEELAGLFSVPADKEPGSEEFAESLALKVREETGADLALVVVGPNPPPDIEPERSRTAPAMGTTYFKLAMEGRMLGHEGSFGGNEQFIQSRVPMFALDLVRRGIVG